MAGYMPGREVPLGIIATTLEQLVPPDGHVIELGSGTSSWAAALCELMPAIRWTAVELDPLLTRVGQEVHGDTGGRLRRVQLDLRDPTWVDDVDPADAVVSVAALHMLGAELIAATYRAVHRILRPGGLLADLDYAAPAVSDPGLGRTLQSRLRTHRRTHGHELHTPAGHRPRNPHAAPNLAANETCSSMAQDSSWKRRCSSSACWSPHPPLPPCG